MCIGLGQFELSLSHDRMKWKSYEHRPEEFFKLKELLPKSFHINLGKSAVIIPMDYNPMLATFAWMSEKEVNGKKYKRYIYNVRAEGRRIIKTKDGSSIPVQNNKSNNPDYDGKYQMENDIHIAHLLEKNRCIVPVDFFVEQPEDSKDKRKFVIRKSDGSPIMLAGLYELVYDQKKETLSPHFSIITTAPTEATSIASHHRSPVIIPNELIHFYLEERANPEMLNEFYKPPSSSGYEVFEVDNIIAKKDLGFIPDDEALIEPIGEVIYLDGID